MVCATGPNILLRGCVGAKVLARSGVRNVVLSNYGHRTYRLIIFMSQYLFTFQLRE